MRQITLKNIILIQAQMSSWGHRNCRPPTPSMRLQAWLLQLLGFTSVARRQRHSSPAPARGSHPVAQQAVLLSTICALHHSDLSPAAAAGLTQQKSISGHATGSTDAHRAASRVQPDSPCTCTGQQPACQGSPPSKTVWSSTHAVPSPCHSIWLSQRAPGSGSPCALTCVPAPAQGHQLDGHVPGSRRDQRLRLEGQQQLHQLRVGPQCCAVQGGGPVQQRHHLNLGLRLEAHPPADGVAGWLHRQGTHLPVSGCPVLQDDRLYTLWCQLCIQRPAVLICPGRRQDCILLQSLSGSGSCTGRLTAVLTLSGSTGVHANVPMRGGRNRMCSV